MPDNLQEAVWRSFDRLTPPWPVTYRLAPEDRLATLAQVGVLHHTALAYPHQPGMLRSAGVGVGADWLRGLLWHNGLRLFGVSPDR